MKIILYRPEIPQNTGNIARTCAATGASLLLIPPLGFQIHTNTLKRSSVNYMPLDQIDVWKEGEEAWIESMFKKCWMFSTRGKIRYDEAEYENEPFLLFGSESSGLPLNWVSSYPERSIYIPMKMGKSSLNLSNAVAIAIYEVLRRKNQGSDFTF